MEQVKLLSVTVALTMLIWVGADSLVNEQVTLNLPFDVAPVGGAQNVIVENANPGEVYEIVVSGPRKLVEDLPARLERARLRLSDRPTGEASITLDRPTVKLALTEQWKEFRKLTVLSVQPTALTIRFDHWITRDVDLVLRRLSLSYDVQPQVQPSFAVVRMRESVFNQMPLGQALQLDIAAEVERILKERPTAESVTIPVALDGRRFGPGAELRPASVDVTATVKSQRRTAVVPTVPILVAVSFANLDKPYQAVTRDGTPLTLVTQSVTVTGTVEEVARLERGASRMYGVIHLKQEDLERADTLRLITPDYYLPPGVALAETPAPIEFKLVPVTAPQDEP